MVHGWQQIKLSFVLPTPVSRFFVAPFAEEVPVELLFCVGVQSIRTDNSVMDRDLIACDFRTSIPALPIPFDVCG
jgi:hypothetical protein